MNMRKYYTRARHPKGFWGFRIIKAMNGKGHAALPEWVLADLQINEDATVLDVGCGGGANIARLLAKCPQGHVTGLDNSTISLEGTKDYNYRDVVDKRCLVVGGNATQMPLAKNLFDVVTAFETVYFWPSLAKGISEVFRVLKQGGTAVIANEMDGLSPEYRNIENAVGMLVYTIDEITEALTKAGFTDIQSRHNEERHFICVTAVKPIES